MRRIQRFICPSGRESIACLVADREFIGEDWVKWLNHTDRYRIIVFNFCHILKNFIYFCILKHLIEII